MIGFDEELAPERGHHSEEPETRHLDKRELYNSLTHRYYLPPYTSKGVTRDYLLKVHRDRALCPQLHQPQHDDYQARARERRASQDQEQGLIAT